MGYKNRVMTKEPDEVVRRLEELESQFNSLVNNNVEGILIIDMRGCILFANPAVKVLLNQQSSLLGQMFGHPLVKGNKVEINIIRRNSNPGFGEMRVEKTTWNGKEAYLVMLLDMTESKLNEELLKKYQEELEIRVRERTDQLRVYSDHLEKANEALAKSNKELEEFAYIASHDIQEPLRIMIMYLDLLSSRYKEKLDLKANEFIHHATIGAQRCQRLVRELLEYAKITTAGNQFQPVSFEDLIKRAISNLQMNLIENSASVTYDPMPTLEVDELQFMQLFQNLIQNAVKYRRPDAIKVHISSQKNEDGWIFSVQDNGIGIEKEHQDRIFGIFQRLPHRKDAEGTGIGLALCKKIIERHGGRIWVESDGQKGSTFYFTVPVSM